MACVDTAKDAVRDTDRRDGEGDGRLGLDGGTGLGKGRLKGSDQEESLKTGAGESC